MMTRDNEKSIDPMRVIGTPARYPASVKRSAVINSTNTYCLEIFDPQYRHFPPSSKKLIIGMRSCQKSVWLQEKHFDLPEANDLPVPKRKITTFKKLPIIAPSTKREKR